MKKIIVANWKCNPPTLSKAKELFDAVKEGIRDCKSAEVIICPPFVFLPILKLYDSSLSIGLGGQDCFWKTEGAFTGEISPLMLKDSGCSHVILGHSERRKNLNETDEMVNKKIRAVLDAKLTPILCVGSEKKGEAGKKEMAVQLKGSLVGITKKDLEKIIITYEPIWAISTSKGSATATPENTKEGKVFIKEILTKLFDKDVAEKTKVIYGGSVNNANINDFIEIAGMDGVLVGAASLRPDDFIAAVKKIDSILNS